MKFKKDFDVIVVGGGHAGTEAALASARCGAKTLLLSQNIETLGQMSCNPAIGGIGKGHLVKEIDALGGIMAKAIDLGGIQFRTLNASKGPAVRATRAQADRKLYKQTVRFTLENQPSLALFQQTVSDLIVEGNKVVGVKTQMGLDFKAKAVVLTAGTFLAGKIHIGLENYSGGRAGDPASVALAEAFAEYMHEVVRKDYWGYAEDEALSSDELINESYKGIRPAPGYPACPDHTEKAKLFELLNVTANTSIELTESYAMYPASAVSGWYFSHPESQYFNVGKIDKDQLQDYAKRKGIAEEFAARWLAAHLHH